MKYIKILFAVALFLLLLPIGFTLDLIKATLGVCTAVVQHLLEVFEAAMEALSR